MVPSLFRSVLSAGIQVTLPILAVMALDPLLRKHIRASALFRLEKILLVGMLLMPLCIHYGPLVRLPVSAPVPPLPLLSPELPLQGTELAAVAQNLPDTAAKPAPALAAFPWEVLWLCGAVLSAVRATFQNRMINQSVGRGLYPVTTPYQRARCRTYCRRMGIKRCPPILVSQEVPSPITLGWLRPAIMLPTQGLPANSQRLQFLLLHELCHCKRGDNFWKMLASIVLAVYWFHPLMWIFSRLFVEDCEIACDEFVLKGVDKSASRCYGRMLISFLRLEDEKRSALILSPQSGVGTDYKAMSRRLHQRHTDPKSPGILFLGICISFLMLYSGVVRFLPFDMRASVLSASQEQLYPALQASHDLGNKRESEENLLGYINQTVPGQTSSIHTLLPPLNTSNVFSWENQKREPFLYSRYLYFVVEGDNKSVLAGSGGTITEVQAKDLEDLNEEEFLMRRLGKYVVLDCGDGVSVRYTFLDSVAVEPGQRVSAGDVLGTAGRTGASYGDEDQCGVYVMQDDLMVDPLLFFDIDVPVQEIS